MLKVKSLPKPFRLLNEIYKQKLFMKSVGKCRQGHTSRSLSEQFEG